MPPSQVVKAQLETFLTEGAPEFMQTPDSFLELLPKVQTVPLLLRVSALPRTSRGVGRAL